MKVLVDINILLDVILRREKYFTESKRIIDCCITFVDGSIALHSFATLFYILHEKEHRNITDCRNIFNNLLYVFDVAGLDKASLHAAVNTAGFYDLEDAMQYKSADLFGADYIITRDRNDFSASDIPAVTPTEFLEILQSKRFEL